MSELLTSFTNLPNLHPVLVHFPIALLPVAVLFDLASFWRGLDWVGRAATILYAAAALGAGAAYRAGEQAADSLPLLPPDLQRLVNEHSDSGLYTLWVMGVLAALRIALELWDRDRARKALRVLFLVAALAGTGLLYRTADLGGGLVYRHGVAVAGRESRAAGERSAAGVTEATGEPPAQAVAAPAVSRLVTTDDGGLEWRPLARDREALGSVLQPAAGSDLGAVAWLEPAGDTSGLHLAVDGEALLVLPGTFGDVQVEAELGLADFEGTVGVAHHVRSADRAGLFTLRLPAKEFALASMDGEVLRELDRKIGDVPAQTARLTVSAIGRHLKGLVGDTTVVHGHEPALPAGACGLLLRGEGTIRLLSMKVTPASG